MNIFIAVLFACAANDCVFIQSSDKYFSQSECVEVVQQVIQAMEKSGAVVQGTCLRISLKDLA